ncbi:alpha/beta fold hydrolase [Bosea sp. (in: a-proteobacteria)]|uniref:alpha/beta fold hydrolase n=1 Tax=Bosea sp. (in: a-proteobacteria) TaxID=1871050 RepID=UPI003B3A076B
MKSVAIAGAQASRMRYHELSGDGPALIFIHGLGCASSCDFPAVAADPTLRGRRMLLVDLLGSGFSDRPEDFGYTVSDHAGCIVALVEHLDLPEVDLFGHSMGGAIAIDAAARLQGRLRRLIVSEPNLVPGGGVFSRNIAAIPDAAYVATGHRAVIQASRADGDGVWAASMAVSAPYAVQRGATALVVGSDPSWRSLLLGLKVPRSFIIGEWSLPYPEADGLAEAGIAIRIVADAGHGMATENPTSLAGAIAASLI